MKRLLFFIGILVSVAYPLQAIAAPAAGGREGSVEWRQVGTLDVDGKPIDMVASPDGKHLYVLTAEKTILVYDHSANLQGAIPAGEGVRALDIAQNGQFLFLVDENERRVSIVSVGFVVDIDTEGAPYKGKADAPVSVAVYADFQWPYCGKLVPLLEQVLKANPETVKIVHKNLPLTSIHKLAKDAAIAAHAAGRQGKFWEYHDKLYAERRITESSLVEIAKSLSLDLEQFQEDRNSPAILQQVNADINEARRLGLTGTPTVFINGRKLQHRSMQGFQQMINEELARNSQ